MKEEIMIASPYAEMVLSEAAKRNISADELVEKVLRVFLERGDTNAE